jgi:uncharacterized membrane protein YqjE
MLECRIGLFATELESDLLRVGKGLILLLLAAIFGAFMLLTLLALLTVMLWETHRLLALSLSAACLLFAAVWCASLAARRLTSGKTFLAQTRAEFEKDRQAFSRSEP